DPPAALQRADVEGVLGAAIAGAFAVEFAVSFLLGLGLLQRCNLRLGKHQPLLRHLGLERLEPFLGVLEVVTLPDTAHAERRDRLAALFELVRYPDLTPARLLDRQFHHRRLNRRIHPVGQDRLRAADLLQRQLAAFVVALLDPVKAVPAITHHLAGLAHIAELLGQLQQSDLGPDHLLCLRHRGSSIRVKLGRVPHLDFPHRSPATVRLSPYLYNQTLYYLSLALPV